MRLARSGPLCDLGPSGAAQGSRVTTTEARGFICIDAFALPSGDVDEGVASTREARDRLHERAWEAPSRENAAASESLELLTFGATDLLVIHRVPDLCFVAVGSVAAPSLHQRSTGGVLGPHPGIGWSDLIAATTERSFHAVVHLKLGSTLALALGDVLPARVCSGLIDALRARMQRDRSIEGADLDSLDALIATGLDDAEILVVLRAPDLTLLARAIEALRSMKAVEVGADAPASRFDGLAFSDLDPDVAMASTPLFAYVAPTVGVPVDIATDPGEAAEEVACGEGALLRLPRPGPVSGPEGLVLANHTGGDLAWRPWSLGEVAALLRDDSAAESHLVVRAWPEGWSSSRVEPAGLEAELAEALRAARSLWLPGGGLPDARTAWGSLADAAARGHWSYGRTNAALTLVSSLVAGLSTPADLGSHLELADPLASWMRQAVAAPHDRDVVARAYRHLDRLMRTRGDCPARRPGTSMAYAARAGTQRIREGFRAYLAEVLAARGLSQITPVLVDSAETSLRVKFGGPLAYFEVSVQRLLNPVLWPAIAHEVEHLRLSRSVGGRGSALLTAYIRRLPDEVWGLASEVDDRTDVSLLDRLDQVHTLLLDDPDPLLRRWGELGPVLVEVAADLAIFDSGVVPGIDKDARFDSMLATLWPNLAMDFRERHGGRRWTPERCEVLARELLFRFVNLWVLVYIDVGVPLYHELLDSRDEEDTWPTTRHDCFS